MHASEDLSLSHLLGSIDRWHLASTSAKNEKVNICPPAVFAKQYYYICESFWLPAIFLLGY